MYTTMPALFEGSAVGNLLVVAIEPGFRSFVQLLLAQINILSFVPVYNNDAVTEEPNGKNEFGVEKTHFQNGLCNQLSEGGHADTALAAMTSIVAWSVLFPMLHLLLHTVSVFCVALCRS